MMPRLLSCGTGWMGGTSLWDWKRARVGGEEHTLATSEIQVPLRFLRR